MGLVSQRDCQRQRFRTPFSAPQGSLVLASMGPSVHLCQFLLLNPVNPVNPVIPVNPVNPSTLVALVTLSGSRFNLADLSRSIGSCSVTKRKTKTRKIIQRIQIKTSLAQRARSPAINQNMNRGQKGPGVPHCVPDGTSSPGGRNHSERLPKAASLTIFF